MIHAADLAVVVLVLLIIAVVGAWLGGRQRRVLGHGYSPRPTWAGTCKRCGAKPGTDCAVDGLARR